MSGDLFSSTADGMAHGANGLGVMGAGIAPRFKKLYPDMYAAYNAEGTAGRLHGGDVFVWKAPGITIFNVISQGILGPNAKLSFVEAGIRKALAVADADGVRTIALPRIGCGIGGLDWADVEPLLEGLAGESICDLEVWAR